MWNNFTFGSPAKNESADKNSKKSTSKNSAEDEVCTNKKNLSKFCFEDVRDELNKNYYTNYKNNNKNSDKFNQKTFNYLNFDSYNQIGLFDNISFDTQFNHINRYNNYFNDNNIKILT